MSRDDRIDIRVDSATKERLTRAADLSHQTLSNFLIAQASAAADRILLDNELLKLSRRDSERFVKALLEDDRPSAALEAAAEEYRDAVEKGRLTTR